MQKANWIGHSAHAKESENGMAKKFGRRRTREHTGDKTACGPTAYLCGARAFVKQLTAEVRNYLLNDSTCALRRGSVFIA